MTRVRAYHPPKKLARNAKDICSLVLLSALGGLLGSAALLLLHEDLGVAGHEAQVLFASSHLGLTARELCLALHQCLGARQNRPQPLPVLDQHLLILLLPHITKESDLDCW